ncbi:MULTISPECIES: hypothetical protein [unclassified Mesorhizobium]|uniref:hypothetical protein n=1 Tax=unclassified Mesorhizobium TaxID=325217 RepID=UPI000FCB7D76|nr:MULTISPECIES: hypothetical protein [unclassified Mesorhizobium]RUV16965.1 hypothetical protein EOA91_19615 [Mesorhizobium sp. M1A.F.Ca.IN.022.04.1.1]RWG29745.1 MAG: hypothetical protein EOQ60_20420 [Mesorhizobium sp.]TIS12407.1 MAG: hypothetical protein E5X10_17925 [Mesorhizobium sp.]
MSNVTLVGTDGVTPVGVQANPLPIAGSALPVGATAVTASSGNVANGAAVATLPGVVGQTTYITGFEITAGGATAAALVAATLSGIVGGTATYIFAAPAGVAVGAAPLVVQFAQPIPASAANTAIVLTLPALGAGNTNAAVVAHGFQQ